MQPAAQRRLKEQVELSPLRSGALRKFELSLPRSGAFRKFELSPLRSGDLKRE